MKHRKLSLALSGDQDGWDGGGWEGGQKGGGLCIHVADSLRSTTETNVVKQLYPNKQDLFHTSGRLEWQPSHS